MDGKLDNSLPNCAIMDNYYVDKPVWMVDLGKSNTKVNGVIVYTWQGAGQGRIPNYNLYLPSFRLFLYDFVLSNISFLEMLQEVCTGNWDRHLMKSLNSRNNIEKQTKNRAIDFLLMSTLRFKSIHHLTLEPF